MNTHTPHIKVGDLCEWVYTTSGAPLCETVVVAIRPESIFRFGLYWGEEPFAYLCQDPDGSLYGAYADQIRLKRPKAWDDWLYRTEGVKDEGDLPVPSEVAYYMGGNGEFRSVLIHRRQGDIVRIKLPRRDE